MLRALWSDLRSPLGRGLLIYLVLPNLAFYVLGRFLFLNRVYVNTDYLILWAVAGYLPRVATAVIYALLVDLDLILSTESVYHFTTAEMIVLARQLLEMDPVKFYAVAGGIVATVLVALALAWRSHLRRASTPPRAPILVGIAGLLVSVTSVSSYTDPYIRADIFSRGAIVGSGIAETVLATYRLSGPLEQADNAGVIPIANAVGSPAEVVAPYDVLLILVESQGLLKNAADMRSIFSPLTSPAIRSRYDIKTGSVQFFGGTMFGELRSLCRIYWPDTTPQNLPRLDHCLPNVLRARGYDAVSYHSFYAWIYERKKWYPALGFARSHFADDMLPGTPPSARCGTVFKGLCDLWVADQVEKELAEPGRKLVYWLTVNSHLPVDSGLAQTSGFDCAGTGSLREREDPCDLARIHFQLYTRIGRIILNRELTPTRFIIVGDHMPPFTDADDRILYDEKRVPFVDLTPKAVAAGSWP